MLDFVCIFILSVSVRTIIYSFLRVCAKKHRLGLPLPRRPCQPVCLWGHIVPELSGANKDALFLNVVSLVGWGAWCTPGSSGVGPCRVAWTASACAGRPEGQQGGLPARQPAGSQPAERLTGKWNSSSSGLTHSSTMPSGMQGSYKEARLSAWAGPGHPPLHTYTLVWVQKEQGNKMWLAEAWPGDRLPQL